MGIGNGRLTLQAQSPQDVIASILLRGLLLRNVRSVQHMYVPNPLNVMMISSLKAFTSLQRLHSRDLRVSIQRGL